MYLIIILAILAGNYVLSLIAENLNLSRAATQLPEEFAGLYDPRRYKKSQEYLKDNTGFELFTSTVFIVIIIGNPPLKAMQRLKCLK